MSYPSQNRLPYGMTTVQPIPGVPGMAGVAMPGMPGMTQVQVSRVPNGMSSMYQSEKSAALYPGANPSYQSLAQQGFLAQSGSLGQAGSLGQPGAAFYGTCNQHPTYLPVTSPSTQQRYMVSAGYPGAGSLVTSPSMVQGAAAGYPLTAGAGYSLSAQPSSLAQPVPVSSPGQSQYPTYISSQLTPLQISPSQNPYAASATGHPLYPGSPYASLQMAGAQMPSGQIPGRSPASAGAGLPLGYPASHIGSTGFYPAP
ncbi:collagen alpha-1(X) chain-like isoform X2 [Mercenaria mercenaria]|uniref:collagen alpha-1(X) chain-like isoform X2 n=1 Tax=Mercenaria mercenaria TaxID=6596 RepID=UPI001E1E007E|nr:collagen alpha-1(X) chain-like isoform X2 [Mercenaria mercenaria]